MKMSTPSGIIDTASHLVSACIQGLASPHQYTALLTYVPAPWFKTNSYNMFIHIYSYGGHVDDFVATTDV